MNGRIDIKKEAHCERAGEGKAMQKGGGEAAA